MKKSNLIILLACAGTLFACKKSLNALPDQYKVEGNVIIDQRSAEVALNGAYYRFAEAGDDRGTQSTQTSYNHEIMPAWATGLLDYAYGGGVLTDNAMTADSYDALNIWTQSYLLVNAANGVIEGVEALPSGKIDAARKSEIIGEARFLRAYGNSRLLQYYAEYWDENSAYGVMLRKQTVTSDNIAQARSSVKESYDYILADLDDAIANAPATNEKFYATSWAAKALKARILINRGDYAEVISLTQDVIQNSGFVLEPSTKDIFFTKGIASNEVILGTTPLPAQVTKSDTYNYNNSPYYLPTDALRALYAGDPRADWVLGEAGITKYLNPLIEYAYMFRLSEMYLLEAEAIVRNNGDLDEARDLVKEVMTHGGVTSFTAIDNATTADELLVEMFRETVRAMLCEDGQEWYALLRLPLETVTTLRPTIVSRTQFIFPVPRTEFDKNNAFGPQNPGYNQ